MLQQRWITNNTQIGHLPGVGDSVRHQLESLYASMLGRQRNEINLRAFEERAELFRALLAAAEKSAPAGSV